MRILSIFFYLISITGFSQPKIKIKAELSQEAIFDNNYMEFILRVKNCSNDTIIIPGKSTSLLSKEKYSERDIGYEIMSGQKSSCVYTISYPIIMDYQKVGPQETAIIKVNCPKDCFPGKERFQLVFYLKVLARIDQIDKLNYSEVLSKPFWFKWRG